MKRGLAPLLLFGLLVFRASSAEEAPPPLGVDVCVYGGTPGGIMAAIAAAREGASVVLLEQTRHVGGLSTSGLNRDEREHMIPSTLGGLCERFTEEAHRRSRPAGRKPADVPAGRLAPARPRTWQSHVAERVFNEMLEAHGVPVRYEQLLGTVKKDESRIVELQVRGGQAYRAKIYIDATYEGDLMAAAGVSFAVGREARDTYGEALAGVRYLDEKLAIAPYGENGRLLPGVMAGEPPEEFGASPIPICYNIRLNLTADPANRVPIGKPASYDPRQYELLARAIEAGYLGRIGLIFGMYSMPGGKVECNNRQQAIVSMSMPGEQTAWAEASFEEREKIHRRYRDYTQGMIWFLKTDQRVPAAMRRDMARFGLCRDEWQDNDHWPHYLYVRAARRMKGRHILTQHDVTKDRSKDDVIHIGSHFIDSHHVARYAVDEGHIINEGRIWQKGVPFDIPYRAITPKELECGNLLVPVCASASNVAFCALRLEPTWMHLGEVSGIAAAMGARSGLSVQQIPVAELQAKLAAAGIPLAAGDR